jgi:hypothetical protein
VRLLIAATNRYRVRYYSFRAKFLKPSFFFKKKKKKTQFFKIINVNSSPFKGNVLFLLTNNRYVHLPTFSSVLSYFLSLLLCPLGSLIKYDGLFNFVYFFSISVFMFTFYTDFGHCNSGYPAICCTAIGRCYATLSGNNNITVKNLL